MENQNLKTATLQALYPKGWRELLDLLITAGPELGDLVVDGFGSGKLGNGERKH